MDDYDIGQAVTLFIENIRDDSGDLVNPGDLALTIIQPDGTSISKAIGDLTHVSTGHYEYIVIPSTAADAGEWSYRFLATQPYTVGEGTFSVRRSIVLGGVSPLSAGTCSPWAEMSDVCAPCNSYDFDPSVLEPALQVASDVLYNFTGRRWPGECSETLRPCGYGTPMHALHQDPVTGYIARGWCGCRDSRSCGCQRLSEVKLPGYPVTGITNVKIDGQIISSDRYRIDDRRWLVYLPESNTAERRGWPCCQRLDLPDSEQDTWSITYTYGIAPPLGGIRAAATLACQLALACDASTASQCLLPKRVTSITRQGVTLAILDPLTLFKDGLTGLADVDMWVQSILRGDKTRRATVHVPGRSQRHRRAGR